MRVNAELERKAIQAWYEEGNSLVSRAWAWRTRGERQRALELARAAFKELPQNLLEEVLEDIQWAPVMDQRGFSVRELCRRCKGSGVVISPVIGERHYWLMDPEMRGDWELTCPECGGEGLAQADLSWDWPPEEGYDGQEAR